VENVIIKFTADTEGLQPAIRQLELIGKITTEDAEKVEQLNKEQREYIASVNQSATAMGQLATEAKDVADSIRVEVLKGAATEIGNMGEEAQKGAQKVKSMKQELRELKAQIARGTLGEKEMREATKRAAELEDTIGDVSERIKGLASDTKRIDATVQAFQALAAVGTVATGVYAALGADNKELEKTLLKVQAAMAVLTGVQELATIATGNLALKTLFLDNAQKLAAVSSRVLGVTITTSMAAATMGISLLIGAIAGVVAAMSDAEDSSTRLAHVFEDNLSVMEKANDRAIENRFKGREQEILKQNMLFDREHQQLKKQLKEQKITESTYRYAIEQLNDEHRRKIAEINAKYNAREVSVQQQLELNRLKRVEVNAQNEIRYIKRAAEIKLENLRNEYKKEQISLIEFTAREKDIIEQAAFDIKKVEEKELEERKKQRKDKLGEIVKLEQAASNLKIKGKIKELDEQSSFEKAQIAAAKEFNTTQEQLMEEFYASDIENFEEYLAKKRGLQTEADERRKKQLENAEIARSIIQVGLDVFKELNQRKLDADLQAMQDRMNAELQTKDLTEAQRAQIEERYRQQEKRAKEQAFKNQKQADIITATINTALAVSRALSTPPAPNVALAAAAGIAGGAQVALIASQPMPRFAEGTEMFNTSGTGTSDSGMAWLSHGERVVPAGINADYWTALSAIHNRKVSPQLANSVIEELAYGGNGNSAGFDYDRFGRILNGKPSSKVVINLDERGFTKHVIRERGRTAYRNSKMRLEA